MNEPITIEYTKQGWIVRQGDRYADYMCWDEMMGLLAYLTIPKNFSHGNWMMTEEQHRKAHPWEHLDQEEKPKETLLLEVHNISSIK